MGARLEWHFWLRVPLQEQQNLPDRKLTLAEAAQLMGELKMGDPADFSCFMGAGIGPAAFERLAATLAQAARDPDCRIVAGGGADASVGYFVQPTLIEV